MSDFMHCILCLLAYPFAYALHLAFFIFFILRILLIFFFKRTINRFYWGMTEKERWAVAFLFWVHF
jgi:hypothetical protein